MTDDQFEQLILFHLIDVDLTDINYLAVDYDGEIVYGIDRPLHPVKKMSSVDNNLIVRWFPEEQYNFSRLSSIFISDKHNVPENHKHVMIKL